MEGSAGEGGTGGGFATEGTECTERRKGRERGEKERERRIVTRKARKNTDGRERCGVYISLVQRLESMDDIAAANRIDRSDAPA